MYVYKIHAFQRDTILKYAQMKTKNECAIFNPKWKIRYLITYWL